jgi:sulfate adenylyltransferase subunit 1
VIDSFKTHKTMGEVLLIDRVSNTTSACGVVESIGTVASSGHETTFRGEFLSAGTNIFDEFYCDVTGKNIQRAAVPPETYELGSRIPIGGESYSYPENFDILILSAAAVSIRRGVVDAVIPLEDYAYSGEPLVDENGFGIRAGSSRDAADFLDEYKKIGKEETAEFYNKWLSFGTFRRVVFR